MPDPFRHYEGVPVLDLPADPPAPPTPALEVLHGQAGVTAADDGPAFLSQLLFYSASISASKRVPSTGYRYALRVNPSSGNLHPTEFHFLTRGLKDWPDGLYHYRPSSHMAEQRALGGAEITLGRGWAAVTFILTSIAWREAWKYGERAYRYCLLDIGHAWQSLALAAQAMGCEAYAIGSFPDDPVAQALRLNPDEWPMLLIELRGATVPLREPDASETLWYRGEANRLSVESIAYPGIEAVHEATKVGSIAAAAPGPTGCGSTQLPRPASSLLAFGNVVRARRSALDFVGGPQSISLPQLSAILTGATAPLAADFGGAHFIQLYMYAHRVYGLEPGVYRLWPERAELEWIKSGDQRIAAAGLSLGQDLAGNACIAFSMIGDLERAAGAFGERGYRYVHFEAGAIGQRLYLGAEALGLRSTGIGAFFDDQVHRYLDISPEDGQVVYHFAIGYPVPDPRVEG